MRIFILEDDPVRIKHLFRENLIGHALTIVETVDAAIEQLAQHEFDLIFLDHDLGGKQYVDPKDEPTGQDVADWLSQRDDRTTVIIHSCNTVGAERMEKTLKRNRFVVKIPAPTLADYLRKME